MMLPFVDRSPTAGELERFRLILSTYQDGSGMLQAKDDTGRTLPGWRDFERATASAFGGTALESKNIYDVHLSRKGRSRVKYGISCKMKEELRRVDLHGEVYIELSNATGAFWGWLKQNNIYERNYHLHAAPTGKILIRGIEEWHYAVDFKKGTREKLVDTSKSLYLVLQYDLVSGLYQIFQFPILMPEPETITWSVIGRHLIGELDGRPILDWYAFAGGQLKYYPRSASALWISERFKLEPLPNGIEAGLPTKAAAYFPVQWARIAE